MRHRVYGFKLGRDKDERNNLFKGLLASLFTHGTIYTSEIKAKAIKGLIDRVINLAKEKNTTRLSQFITKKDLQTRLIKEIVPKMANRNSGYTSIIRVGTRSGDQTMMVKLSLIGAEELKPIEKSITRGKSITSTTGKKPVKTRGTSRIKSTTRRSVK